MVPDFYTHVKRTHLCEHLGNSSYTHHHLPVGVSVRQTSMKQAEVQLQERRWWWLKLVDFIFGRTSLLTLSTHRHTINTQAHNQHTVTQKWCLETSMKIRSLKTLSDFKTGKKKDLMKTIKPQELNIRFLRWLVWLFISSVFAADGPTSPSLVQNQIWVTLSWCFNL